MLSGLPDVSEMEAADSGFDRTCEIRLILKPFVKMETNVGSCLRFSSAFGPQP